jgi:hypothetical protein
MTNQIQIKRSLTSTTPPALANGELAYTANGDVLYIGSPNGSIVAIGGLRVPGTLTANHALVANSTGYINEVRTANLVTTKIYANSSHGSMGQVLTANSSGGVYWNNPVSGVAGTNTQVQFNDSGVLAGDSGLTYNSTTDTLSTNNVLATSVVNAATLSVGTSFIANSTVVTINPSVGLNANGTTGTAGQFFLSNGTTPYWATIQGLDTSTGVLTVKGANGIVVTVDGVNVRTGTNSGLLANASGLFVTANNGLLANSSGLFVKAGTGVTVNSSGVNIGQAVETTSDVTFNKITATGNVALGDNTTDIVSITGAVNTNIMPSANATYNLGSSAMSWGAIYAANIQSGTGKFDGNVEIAGNLTITGSVSNVAVTDLVVSDPLIHIGANNETSDTVDLGFVGHYSDDGGTNKRHAGLFRDATDGTFRLFTNLIQADLDTATAIAVNTAAVSYGIASLQAYLTSGAFVSNSTTVAITANASINVAIIANTLTLSTALPGTSGGTGRATTTNNAILVGNSTNGYNELTLGTSGYVLQSNGTSLVYDTLDGGSF